MVLACEENEHELEIFEVGDVYDLLRCKICGQLGTEWN